MDNFAVVEFLEDSTVAVIPVEWMCKQSMTEANGENSEVCVIVLDIIASVFVRPYEVWFAYCYGKVCRLSVCHACEL